MASKSNAHSWVVQTRPLDFKDLMNRQYFVDHFKKYYIASFFGHNWPRDG